MSIVCTETNDLSYSKRTMNRQYVLVTFDPTSAKDPLPFPSDYKYFSCLLPSKYALWADRIYNFKVRPDDIWVLGYAKTGTSWMRNIVNQLKIKHLDFTAEYVQLGPDFLEAPALADKINESEEVAKFVEKRETIIDQLDALPSPRMIKSHLPAYLLPKDVWTVKPKIIYTSRDAKDVAVSAYHMTKNHLYPYTGTMSEFFADFCDDPTFYGSYCEHISSFHQLRHFKHLLMVTYEEMIADTFEAVKRVSNFLECSYSNEQLHQLIEHVSFGKMREKLVMPTSKSSDPEFKFCRKGKVGGYQDEMSEEDIKRFDEWSAKMKRELNLL